MFHFFVNSVSVFSTKLTVAFILQDLFELKPTVICFTLASFILLLVLYSSVRGSVTTLEHLTFIPVIVLSILKTSIFHKLEIQFNLKKNVWLSKEYFQKHSHLDYYFTNRYIFGCTWLSRGSFVCEARNSVVTQCHWLNFPGKCTLKATWKNNAYKISQFVKATYSNNPITRLYPAITEGRLPHEGSDVMSQRAVVFLP